MLRPELWNDLYIDKLYTQMGKVFRLPWILNLLLSCALGSRHCICAYTETVDPARQPGIPQPWLWHSTVYGSGQLGSIWEKKRQPPPFTHLAVLFFYGVIAFKYLQWLVHMINVAATNKLCLITIERWKFCFRGLEESGYHFFSRYFAPWVGIPEDPVCGSAHTVLAPFWQAILDR